MNAFSRRHGALVFSDANYVVMKGLFQNRETWVEVQAREGSRYYSVTIVEKDPMQQ